ncbi:ATP-binding protein [Rhizobium lusitanum]|uniref:ATP-binding protein n=1 Tax=Rhizobium lusitanum TaxID=293958 RepID=UPI0019591FC5|nr:ATP-binding protein [Rhizobium lusitanum]MBM7043587.1 TniB family NTP-binding protein [Rhizobium lusitanum]
MTNAKSNETSDFAALKAGVRGSYFTTGRDTKLASYLREMAVNVEDCELGAGSKRRALFVIGDSGSGKTRSLQHHFETMPEFRPYLNEHGETVSPVLSIDAPRPCNTKALAIAILTALGLPTKERMTEHTLFAVLKVQLRERGVKYLHIDEMQHVMRHNTATAIRHVQDTLKSLIQIADWPLHTIYSGVPELAELLRGDPQLANRSRVLRYDALNCPADTQWITGILAKVTTEGCGLGLSAELLEDDFPEKLCLAGNGAFGSMIAMVQEACFRALERGRKSLSLKEFARNYERDTGCMPRDNVFTAARWRDLVPRHALADLA